MNRYYQNQAQIISPNGVFWPNPKQIGPFTMIDQDNNEFGIEQLQGKWSFVFFGYTNCPDVCPITMSVLKQVDEGLGNTDITDDIQVVFVSVDPERDTIDNLKGYIDFFNPGFTGLGGSVDQLESLSSQIGIAYMYGIPDEDGHYLVSHTSSIFLLDPQARLISILSPPHQSENIINRFIEISRFIINQKS